MVRYRTPQTVLMILSLFATFSTFGCALKINGNYSLSAPITLPLTVAKVYPRFGANWLDYVKNDGADIFSGSDTACLGTETGFAACIHGGQMLKVVLDGLNSCTGLSMSDSLGAFTWICRVVGSTAIFYSLDFQQGKGLQHLVNATDWNFNSVTLSGQYQGVTYTGTSDSEQWWTNAANPITPFPDNHLLTDVPVALNTSGAIYVLASSRATEGYSLGVDKVAMITLPGVVMNYAGANNPGWCGGNYSPNLCLAGHNFLWVEGTYSCNSGGGTNGDHILAAHSGGPGFSRIHLVTEDIHSRGGFAFGEMTNAMFDQINVAGMFLPSSSNNFFKQMTLSGITMGHYGTLDGNSNVFYQVSTSAASNGISLTGDNGNIFVEVTASGANMGMSFSLGSLNNNIVVQSTFTNNNFSGVYVSAPAGSTFTQNTFNNILASNNAVGGFALGGGSPGISNNTYSQLALTNNVNYGFSLGDGTNQNFAGTLLVGNNATADCGVGGGLTSPGLINTTCTDTGVDGSSTYTGQTSNAVLRTNRTVASSFVGKVTSTDPANASNVNGTATFPAANTPFDFFHFSNLFRGWGIDGLTFPDPSDQGQWTAGTGRIWDWRLLASDTVVYKKTGDGSATNGAFVPNGTCPAASYGSVTATDQAGHTYLLNATEIVDPYNEFYSNTGNHNGLCETGEACIYTPNYGAYQGQGALEPCTFVQNGGAVSGVQMEGHTTNGI